MPTTYLTVAIPYVNADPHLGYAYELVEADVYARARRRAGDRVRFLGGTDDYSLKNVLAAEAAGQPTRAFVDRLARRFEALAGPLDLSFDDFIRTSADPRHRPAVDRLWRAAFEAGDLYRRHYEGEYCLGCERFYDESELVDGRCPEHRTSTERVAEENWFFRLSRYQDHLESLIASDRLAIRPEAFRREALAFVRAGLADISVSRAAARARGWGIPVPEDPSQVIYVWFDALTNYVSALGFGDRDDPAYRDWWMQADERVHVIGKGILRFHAVYWPAFLASAGQPPPTRIQVHPYLTVEGAKLSKSSGTSIDPVSLVDRCGVDALRWYFARDVAETADTDFTVDRLVARANDDLANGIGNVTNRIVTLVHRCCGGRVRLDAEPLAEVTALVARAGDALTAFEIREATRLATDAIAALNRSLDATKPWHVAKHPERADELEQLLGCQAASVRVIATAIEPVVPSLARRILHQLGDADGVLPPAAPTFTRIE